MSDLLQVTFSALVLYLGLLFGFMLSVAFGYRLANPTKKEGSHGKKRNNKKQG